MEKSTLNAIMLEEKAFGGLTCHFQAQRPSIGAKTLP
jgi:hypothetical protein